MSAQPRAMSRRAGPPSGDVMDKDDDVPWVVGAGGAGGGGEYEGSNSGGNVGRSNGGSGERMHTQRKLFHASSGTMGRLR